MNIGQVGTAWRAAWASLRDDPDQEFPNVPLTSVMPLVKHDLDAEISRLIEALAKIEGLQEFAGSPGWQEVQKELEHIINEQTTRILQLAENPKTNETQLVYTTAFRAAVMLLFEMMHLDRLDMQSDLLAKRLYGLYQKQQETAGEQTDSFEREQEETAIQ